MRKKRRRDIALPPSEMHGLLTHVLEQNPELKAQIDESRKRLPPMPDLPEDAAKNFLEALVAPGICALPTWSDELRKWQFLLLYNGSPFENKDTGKLLFFDGSYEEAMDQLRNYLAYVKKSDRTPNWEKWLPSVKANEIVIEPWQFIALSLNIDPDKTLRNLDGTFDEDAEFHSRLEAMEKAVSTGELKAEMRIKA